MKTNKYTIRLEKEEDVDEFNSVGVQAPTDVKRCARIRIGSESAKCRQEI